MLHQAVPTLTNQHCTKDSGIASEGCEGQHSNRKAYPLLACPESQTEYMELYPLALHQSAPSEAQHHASVVQHDERTPALCSIAHDNCEYFHPAIAFGFGPRRFFFSVKSRDIPTFDGAPKLLCEQG